MPRRKSKTRIKCDSPHYHLTKDIGNYVVYGDGRVWSKISYKFIEPGLVQGYYIMQLATGSKRLHRLIAETFLPNPNNLPEVDHINNDKLDNRVENLQWISRRDNTRKAYRDGLIPKHRLGQRGEVNHRSKLTNEAARQIKYELPRLSDSDLAKMFNVSQPTINRIRNSKGWSHI